ncbi:MAG: hypothetical protein CVU77_01300 [Elusimicrobia bacterium HGW-Elusimicrobia-1]|jgi:tetratricopeptide (TPR) repeat protein|nr:MAG: hypothetical protein CVU77_01300 [Elusimicrobia bacterium HGW-Elusimicrobia-1]
MPLVVCAVVIGARTLCAAAPSGKTPAQKSAAEVSESSAKANAQKEKAQAEKDKARGDAQKAKADELAEKNRLIEAARAERERTRKAAAEAAAKIRDGDEAFGKKNYPAAMDSYMQALLIAPDGRAARLRLEKTAQKILDPEKKRIEAERRQVMAAYRKLMGKRKVESTDSLYAKAVSNYNKKNYLKSYEGIRKIISVNPDFKNVKFYDNNITEDMRGTAVADTIPDMEKLSYAKGFTAFYFDKNIAEASRQWERVLAINPRRVEVSDYLKNAKAILDALERDRRIAEITARLAALYGAGEKEFDAKKYVPSIKEWEKVVDLARKESDVPEAPAWETKARDAIKKALEEIEKLAARRRAAPKAEEPAKPEAAVVVDEAAANRYYQEGMVAYAQGRLREAVRSWDLALRMNPGHDRARKAKERAEAELAGGR